MKFGDMPYQIQTIAAEALAEGLRHAGTNESAVELAGKVKVAFEGLYSPSVAPVAVNQSLADYRGKVVSLTIEGSTSQAVDELMMQLTRGMKLINESSSDSVQEMVQEEKTARQIAAALVHNFQCN